MIDNFPNLDYILFIPDYNNGHFTEYESFRVDKETFDLDWTAICNKLPHSYAYGMDMFDIQRYMQLNGIKYLHWGTFTKEKAVNWVELYPDTARMVEHSNMGNY